jgi:hypothetical protein
VYGITGCTGADHYSIALKTKSNDKMAKSTDKNNETVLRIELTCETTWIFFDNK